MPFQQSNKQIDILTGTHSDSQNHDEKPSYFCPKATAFLVPFMEMMKFKRKHFEKFRLLRYRLNKLIHR